MRMEIEILDSINKWFYIEVYYAGKTWIKWKQS
jgi:hypothetical protein